MRLERQLATTLGAVGTRTLNRKVTHLLCPRVEGLKCERAAEWNLPMLRIEWLHDCAARGVLLPEGPYLAQAEQAAPLPASAPAAGPAPGPVAAAAAPLGAGGAARSAQEAFDPAAAAAEYPLHEGYRADGSRLSVEVGGESDAFGCAPEGVEAWADEGAHEPAARAPPPAGRSVTPRLHVPAPGSAS